MLLLLAIGLQTFLIQLALYKLWIYMKRDHVFILIALKNEENSLIVIKLRSYTFTIIYENE